MIPDILALQAVFDVLSKGDIEHMSPGRIRLRFRSRRGDVAFFQQIVSLVSRHPDVEAVDANPETGGVLIRHSMSQDSLDVLFRYWKESRAKHPSEPRRSGPLELPRGRELMGMVFFGLSIIQLLRGHTVGSGSELLWHAVQAERFRIPGAQPVLLLLAMFQIVRGRILSPATSLMMYGLMSAATSEQGGGDEGDSGGVD